MLNQNEIENETKGPQYGGKRTLLAMQSGQGMRKSYLTPWKDSVMRLSSTSCIRNRMFSGRGPCTFTRRFRSLQTSKIIYFLFKWMVLKGGLKYVKIFTLFVLQVQCGCSFSEVILASKLLYHPKIGKAWPARIDTISLLVNLQLKKNQQRISLFSCADLSSIEESCW